MLTKLNFSCGYYLSELANYDPRIWVIDGDLADSDGALPYINNHKNRFIAGGIAEQNMISMAAGLSTTGMRPWVFSFAAFLCYRAYDQIRVSLSQTNLPVTLIGSHAGGCGGRKGKTHLALNDIALISSLPHINIWTPADAREVKTVINNILKCTSPAYIRLPRDPQEAIPYGEDNIRWIGDHNKIIMISYGSSTHWAIKAQKILAKKGINIGILHFSKIWPIDSKQIKYLLRNVKHAFVIEDHYAHGGLNTLLNNLNLDLYLESLAWPNDWEGQSGESKELLQFANLLPEQIANRIKNKVEDY